MFIAQVKIEKGENDEALNCFHSLQGAWRSNGQTLGEEFPMAESDGFISAFLMVPQTDSLEERHDDEYSKRTRNELMQLTTLETQILGESPESPASCGCQESSFYVLFTHFLTQESPLRCGDCFNPIALYTLNQVDKPDAKILDGLRGWQVDYQACDKLQMGCSTGEKFGEREMSKVDGSLTKRGLAICDKIFAATQIPTYYYLHRARGRSDNLERSRQCPSCGGEWLLEEKLHDLFDFKCDKCRLLSNIAFSFW